MKAYRFFSEPGRVVNDGNTGLAMFKFDENGEYVTLDDLLAQRMAPHFRYEEIELVEVKEEEEEAEDTGDDAQATCFPCPHCDFEAATKSGLQAHIRAKHKEV
jgi:hypothetical protein